MSRQLGLVSKPLRGRGGRFWAPPNAKRSISTSLQCRRFLSARNLLAKASCWNFPKREGNGASPRERGGGVERKGKTPARKHCENEKHPLIRRAWPLFRKWVADNNKTTKQSLQSEASHCEFIIVFILTESRCNSPQLMKFQFKLQFILVNRYPWEFNIQQTI